MGGVLELTTSTEASDQRVEFNLVNTIRIKAPHRDGGIFCRMPSGVAAGILSVRAGSKSAEWILTEIHSAYFVCFVCC